MYLSQPTHEIRVSSSNFPRFDRNLNTGEDLFTSTRFVARTKGRALEAASGGQAATRPAHQFAKERAITIEYTARGTNPLCPAARSRIPVVGRWRAQRPGRQAVHHAAQR